MYNSKSEEVGVFLITIFFNCAEMILPGRGWTVWEDTAMSLISMVLGSPLSVKVPTARDCPGPTSPRREDTV